VKIIAAVYQRYGAEWVCMHLTDDGGAAAAPAGERKLLTAEPDRGKALDFAAQTLFAHHGWQVAGPWQHHGGGTWTAPAQAAGS
jgi:hypothetical protein